mgnify:CR=1 FL=1
MIYRRFVADGTPPSRHELDDLVGDPATAAALLTRLHDEHLIVLDDRPERVGEIRMALPFSAEPTDYRVTTDRGAWWANCAWDALAIVAALSDDAHVDSVWSDTGEPLEFDVIDERLGRVDGFVHFQVPARHWWDDIVFT